MKEFLVLAIFILALTPMFAFANQSEHPEKVKTDKQEARNAVVCGDHLCRDGEEHQDPSTHKVYPAHSVRKHINTK